MKLFIVAILCYALFEKPELVRGAGSTQFFKLYNDYFYGCRFEPASEVLAVNSAARCAIFCVASTEECIGFAYENGNGCIPTYANDSAANSDFYTCSNFWMTYVKSSAIKPKLPNTNKNDSDLSASDTTKNDQEQPPAKSFEIQFYEASNVPYRYGKLKVENSAEFWDNQVNCAIFNSTIPTTKTKEEISACFQNDYFVNVGIKYDEQNKDYVWEDGTFYREQEQGNLFCGGSEPRTISDGDRANTCGKLWRDNCMKIKECDSVLATGSYCQHLGVNIARNKECTMSESEEGSGCDRALDGLYWAAVKVPTTEPVAFTKQVKCPKLVIDLGRQYLVKMIRVVTPADPNTPLVSGLLVTLHDFSAEEASDSKFCYRYNQKLPAGSFRLFRCKEDGCGDDVGRYPNCPNVPVDGRFVAISHYKCKTRSADKNMALVEVEVYGDEI